MDISVAGVVMGIIVKGTALKTGNVPVADM